MYQLLFFTEILSFAGEVLHCNKNYKVLIEKVFDYYLSHSKGRGSSFL